MALFLFFQFKLKHTTRTYLGVGDVFPINALSVKIDAVNVRILKRIVITLYNEIIRYFTRVIAFVKI